MANTLSKYGSKVNRPLCEIVGLSTDTKPIDAIEGYKIQNGSIFIELDTDKKFLFDAENSVWIEISSGSGGGGGGGSTTTFGTDVLFYDYDGSVVMSYSADDFANLTAMPDNPSHEGLTAQGWNWSLEDAKTYVSQYGKLNIGQMYITDDGKTRFYFTVTKNNLSVYLQLNLESDTELDVDWGDGSEHTTWTSGDSSKSHNYASDGRYIIAIEVITGEFNLSSALSNIYKIEIGNGFINIGDSVFYNCSALSTITIPNSVTSIGSYVFQNCYALSSITIPDSVTSIGNGTFYSCSSLSSITIPDGVTSIGNSAFYYCSALSTITIPSSVTSIGGDAFDSCHALSTITIPSSVTSIDSSAFYYCSVLSSITIPNSVTSIGSNAFGSCSALSTITIPNSVTSIGDSAFFNCSALSSITIPSSVTNIGYESDYEIFGECHALSSITFESTTPPEMGSRLGIPDTCTIRVPQGSLSAYTTASNYPDPADYIYEEY